MGVFCIELPYLGLRHMCSLKTTKSEDNINTGIDTKNDLQFFVIIQKW